MHVFCNLYSRLDSEGLRLHLRHSVTSRMPVAKPTCLARSYAAWSALWADGLAASTEGHLPANRNGKRINGKESPFDATAVAQQYLTLFPEDEQLNYPGFARGRFGQTLISRAQELQELSTTRLQEICGQVSVHAQCAKHGPTWHLRHSYTDCECCRKDCPDLSMGAAPKGRGRPAKKKRNVASTADIEQPRQGALIILIPRNISNI